MSREKKYPGVHLVPHPRPQRLSTGVLPVFLPHHGCPPKAAGRCVYCAQHAQTGVAGVSLEHTLLALKNQLQTRVMSSDPPVEVGFYGATFTALPDGWDTLLVELAAGFKVAGAVSRIRCSTRPDECDSERLNALRHAGLDMVELGIQSFNHDVLRACGRGYTGRTALDGCSKVRAAGLDLGLHLMLGLPGQSGRVFREDVALAVLARPSSVRLHPCLVLENTPLAGQFRDGHYQPWELGVAIDALADALLDFWRAGIHVIRVGLAPEDSLNAAVLAGPQHPALGQRAASLALFRHLRETLTGAKLGRLLYPRRYESDVLGWQRERLPDWAALGLGRENLQPWDEAEFGLNYEM